MEAVSFRAQGAVKTRTSSGHDEIMNAVEREAGLDGKG